MIKIGLSTCGKEPTYDTFMAMMAAGIEIVELSLPTSTPEVCDAADYPEIRRAANEAGITINSYHFPFVPFEKIDISNPALADSTVEFFKSLMKRVTDIGVKTFVIHPSGEPIADSERRSKMECAKKSLYALAEYADTLGAVICVENLPRTCLSRDSEGLLELISAHPSLRVCFDTNHLLGEDSHEFIRKVGEKIVTIHVSDYDFIDERHWMPGEGEVDWQQLFKDLLDIGYRGPWLYEVGYRTPKTITRSREITPFDIANNAREIFEGKPLTRV